MYETHRSDVRSQHDMPWPYFHSTICHGHALAQTRTPVRLHSLPPHDTLYRFCMRGTASLTLKPNVVEALQARGIGARELLVLGIKCWYRKHLVLAMGHTDNAEVCFSSGLAAGTVKPLTEIHLHKLKPATE